MTRDGIDEVGTTATTEVLDLRDWSVSALLAAYAGILRELVQRGLIRTLNAPAGDLAETLAAKSYDGALAPNSEKSWDIRAFDGRLIQVKSRVIASTSRTKPVQFSVFRSWGFDVAIFVVFAAETYEVLAAIELPMQSVREKAGDVAWVGGSRLTVSIAVLQALPEAVDRTPEFAAALTAL
ncbi:DUF6998 domain-containing protein [Agromyces bauzanensis]|uniref:DUF6998 domain-containing protein n=1 Tax=Agromyces bauzanensis TaxID=1308924 RepID=A0A917PVD6_9MICO|nr:hypothetical protein [Agromyces bauzanensis]GGJ94573.1 hypothetical protein GCM10011372_36130 [Agromyces bauzanensis]